MIKKFWNEEWKDIAIEVPGLQLTYAVSDYGRVVSYSSTVTEGRLLKGTITGGYRTLNLKPSGKYLTIYVHRAIAQAFLTPLSADHKFVIHLDHNKTNNHINNLRWATKEEMEKHQQLSPAVIERKKKRHFKGHKLTETKVRLIKKMINDPNRKTRMKIIAKQFGVTEMQLYRIKSGENWGHVEV
jgi:hypothetical protein